MLIFDAFQSHVAIEQHTSLPAKQVEDSIVLRILSRRAASQCLPERLHVSSQRHNLRIVAWICVSSVSARLSSTQMGSVTKNMICSATVVIVLSVVAFSVSDIRSFNSRMECVLCAMACIGSFSSCKIDLSADAMARMVWKAAGSPCASSKETRRISWKRGRKHTRFWGFNCSDGAMNRTREVSKACRR